MSKFSKWLSDWDQGKFEFSEQMMGDLHEKSPDVQTLSEEWKHQDIKNIEEKENKIFAKIYPVLSVVFALVIIAFFIMVVLEMPKFGDVQTPANASEVIKRYIESGLEETGAVNIVAGVILDYRAFDTLGESHVLYTASMVVTSLLLLLKAKKEPKEESEILEKDPVLRCAAKVLVPLVLMFGAYVILEGHIGPGGGFSGGAIIGGGLILYAYAFGCERLSKILNEKSYKIIVLCALGFYSFAKCYSFYCGAHHLETIFSTGTPGAIISAGLIFPLNIAVGIVVACTMYGFYSYFTRGHI